MSSLVTTLTLLAVLFGVGCILLGAALLRLRGTVRRLRTTLDTARAEMDTRARRRAERLAAEARAELEAEFERRLKRLERREREVERRRAALAERRSRLEERAARLDGRAEELSERATALDARAAALDEREQRVADGEQALRAELEKVAGLTAEEARERLIGEVEREVRDEIARVVERAEREARASAERRARALVIDAMGSIRNAVAGEATVSVVRLPSDEMKGRVIGREGRNIRALELATGVDLLVDDTPEAILLSCWDPRRRTIAARALQKLVEDGRIHPARIEEVVAKTREEVEEEARARGEETAYELGITGLHERLVLLVGRLAFITAGGRTLLARSTEVALLAGAIADELGLGGEALRRAGLLHEIARADDAPLLAHPAVASAEVAARYGERPEVTDPIRALAQPADAPRRPGGVVLATARRLALARPGARHHNLQRHMDRLRGIEKLALAHPGVERAMAVRAGRQLRVHVRASEASDEDARLLARRLAKEIERRSDFNGSIRVIVIRETRAIAYAV
ncbi:MAG: DUF3552 domain-containing protein [Acidobacteria bacterium]|nr:MAG: DUF3552 domain-containing protein [Acidobacteriota bacterium]